MKNLKNCKRCGKLFVKVNKDICPDCVKQEEEEFTAVKEYLDKNPNATISNVSEETGVSEKMIRKFIEDGRLLTTKYSAVGVECKRCGKEISKGRYCEECQVELQKQLGALNQDKPKEKEEHKGEPRGSEPPSIKETGQVHIRDRWQRRRR